MSSSGAAADGAAPELTEEERFAEHALAAQLAAEETVSAIVFACSDEKANGKQIRRITANAIPIHRARSPRCM